MSRDFMKKILKNKAQCLNCKDILESIDVHDWVSCSCWGQEQLKMSKDLSYMAKHGIFIDGGTEYLRRGYVVESEVLELSEYSD